MKNRSKLLHGLVLIAGGWLLLLPVSVNAFVVKYSDLANFSLDTITTVETQPSVPDLSELSLDSTLTIGSSVGSGLVSDATENLLDGVSLSTNDGYTDTFLQVEMPYSRDGTSLIGDDFSGGIKVSEPGSILLMGLGLMALLSVVRMRQG